MATSKIVLDRQAVAQTFPFGTTSASGQGLVTINNGTASASNVVLDIKGSQNIAGDLNLTGNLNITGSIDEQTVTNLSVKDLNIRTNKGGTTAGAAGAGLQVEGDTAATIAALSYDSTLASGWKIGKTTVAEVIDATSVQTLTNKTLTSNTNTIYATGLQTTGAAVTVNGAAPPTGSGQALVSTSATTATWQTITTQTFKRTAVSGTQDGSNKTFTIANAVATNSEQVILNGQVLNPGSSNDYTISSTTITFSTGFVAPAATDVIQVFGSY